jgi:hypothetical protein
MAGNKTVKKECFSYKLRVVELCSAGAEVGSGNRVLCLLGSWPVASFGIVAALNGRCLGLMGVGLQGTSCTLQANG